MFVFLCYNVQSEEEVLKKIGVLELNTTIARMVLADIADDETFVIIDREQAELQIASEIAKNEMITPESTAKLSSILKSFRAKCLACGVTETYAVANDEFAIAKNQRSFFDEIYSQSGFKFSILTAEEFENDLYLSFINSLDCPKGLIVSIDGTTTKILAYNRRNIVNRIEVAVGGVSLADKYAEKGLTQEKAMEQIAKEFASKLKKIDWFDGLDSETQIVGTGETFLSLARLSRKLKQYRYLREHAYQMTAEDFQKVFEFIKTLDIDKTKRLKGVSHQRADVLASSLSILNVIVEASGIKKLIVSENGVAESLIFSRANPATLEKPITDVLGYSLDCINQHYNNSNIKNTKNVYNLSVVLYRQLKVLHKLPRNYAKVLRIASYMHDSGLRISATNFERKGFSVVLDSDIYGVAHHEQVLAGFVVACQHLDDFNMTDWVSYSSILNDNDLEAVRKLAVIVRLANMLDAYGSGKVKDISCDILGDSVIMKTIVAENSTPAEQEIKEAMTVAKDFAKAFKKHLEVL